MAYTSQVLIGIYPLNAKKSREPHNCNGSQLNSKGEVYKIYDAHFDDETNWRQMHLGR